MICGNCGAQLDGTTKFCVYCGNPVPTEPFGDFSRAQTQAAPKTQQNALNSQYPYPSQDPESTVYSAPYMPEPPYSNPIPQEPAYIPPVGPQTVYPDPTPMEPEKPKKKKHTGAIIALVVVLVLLIGGFVGYKLYTEHVYQQNKADYEAAELMLEKRDYDGALEAFQALGDFKDSKKQAKALKELQESYDEALELLEDRSYDRARTAFAELGDYRDSENYVNYEITYQEADSYRSAGENLLAAQLYDGISDYQDSEDLASACRLDHALGLLNAGSYDDAMLYEELLDTADAATLQEAYSSLCADEAFIQDLESIFVNVFTAWNYYPDTTALKNGITTLKSYQDIHFDDATLADYVDTFITYFSDLDDCTSQSTLDDLYYYGSKCLLFDAVDDIWASHGAFAETELYNNYVNKADLLYMFYTVEKKFGEWYDGITSSEYDSELGQSVSYYNNTGYKFSMKVQIYYYDENDNWLYTGTEKLYTFDKGSTVKIQVEPDTDMSAVWYWKMDWEIDTIYY